MPDALISVIVPVYNMAPWLDRCLESVVGQTYKTLEIILVDDGSTDASGSMCDLWARKDARIQVIHKPNGGLSDARNAGIEAATGDYLSFVDSDDWLDLTMISALYTALTENGADIAVCGHLWAYDDYTLCRHRYSGKTTVLDHREVFEAVVRQRFPASDPAVWNKLYARHLWDTVRFPVGKLCEDRHVRSWIYAQCQKVAVVDKALYFYYQREGSIMNPMTYHGHLQLSLDGLEACIQDCAFIKEQYPQLEIGANALVIDTLMGIYAIKCHNGGLMPPQIDREITDTFRQYKKGIWKYLRFYSKIKFLLFSISPALFYYVGSLVWKLRCALGIGIRLKSSY